VNVHQKHLVRFCVIPESLSSVMEDFSKPPGVQDLSKSVMEDFTKDPGVQDLTTMKS
jgi:hypothetical protein